MTTMLPALQPYIYDGHGHSTASDGLHSPEQIIDSGIKKGLNIIGLSDHNVVSNLPRFLDYADKINAHKTLFLPIASIEYSTTEGHILITIPDRHKAENFISQYKKPTKRPHPIEVIEEHVEKYNAIAVFVHPETEYINGLKISTIERILTKIPVTMHKNIGIEVNNWMSQAFFWNRSRREIHLHKKCLQLGLSPFSFTDYHSADNVGNGSTVLYMQDLSSHSFIEAIQQHRTAPYATSSRTINEYIQIVKTTLLAESRSRLQKKDFHIPKT